MELTPSFFPVKTTREFTGSIGHHRKTDRPAPAGQNVNYRADLGLGGKPAAIFNIDSSHHRYYTAKTGTSPKPGQPYRRLSPFATLHFAFCTLYSAF